MRLRLSFIFAFVGLFCSVLLILSWSNCSLSTVPRLPTPQSQLTLPAPLNPPSSSPLPIECIINSETSIHCLRTDEEIFVPFSFLQSYFEVYGKVVKSPQDGQEKFDWQHSYSKVYHPKAPYDPKSKYLWLESYNVEVRDRVKCISGSQGVPVSVQWDPQGHLYPIQVAQYGLSHFSKNLSEPPPSVVELQPPLGRWVPSKKASIKETANGLSFSALNGEVIKFRLTPLVPETTLVMDVALETPNSSVTVVLESRGDSKTASHPGYRVRYTEGGGPLDLNNFGGRIIEYRLGSTLHGRHLARNLIIDLQKGIRDKKVSQLRHYRIRQVELRGQGMVGNVTLHSSAHIDHFYDAANWLLQNQDSSGGWPIMVTRKLSNGALILPKGWYSSMAQGQAMSVLTRAYLYSGNKDYLVAAINGLEPFHKSPKEHGVRTTFLGKLPWYEEYPTMPSSFVLNGFMFALFGLYDLSVLCQREVCEERGDEAGELFREGLNSLKHMLPLFDTGSGSVYDLRHASLNVPPNRARWDYHSTHVNQLLWLGTLDRTPLWQTTAARWASYMKGHRAPHN